MIHATKGAASPAHELILHDVIGSLGDSKLAGWVRRFRAARRLAKKSSSSLPADRSTQSTFSNAPADQGFGNPLGSPAESVQTPRSSYSLSPLHLGLEHPRLSRVSVVVWPL